MHDFDSIYSDWRFVTAFCLDLVSLMELMTSGSRKDIYSGKRRVKPLKSSPFT